jgi:hypothetical protein
VKKGSIVRAELGQIPGVRDWPGWTGAFTRDQAQGALFLNKARIKKAKGELQDLTPLGTEGTVLGSLHVPGIGFGYFVEWDNKKRHAIFVVGWKIGRA